MSDLKCKRCGKSLWLHPEMDFSDEWKEGDTCEQFVKDETPEVTGKKRCTT